MSLLHSTRPWETIESAPRYFVSLLGRERYGEWDSLVTKSPHGTIFHNSWWLDAVGQDFTLLGCWDSQTGKLVAGIPLPWKRRAGLRLYHPPRLTPYLGPIFDLSDIDNTSEQLSLMRHCGEQLALGISGFDCLYYIAGASAPDLQGFAWAGFRIELAYTFRFDAGMTPENVFEQITRTHRQKLKKNAQYSIEAGDDVRALATLSNQTFERQGIACPFSERYLRQIWEAASGHGKATLYTARDSNQRPVSSLLVVHDERTSYQIVSGIDATLRDSPAGYLLTWRAICDALNAGRSFDFEGSAIRGVEKYYRRWGAAARPVWQLKKDGSLRGWLARAAYREFSLMNARTAVRGNAAKAPQASGAETPLVEVIETKPAEKMAVRIARSIMRWASPNAGEEMFSWRHLGSCGRILDVACGVGSFISLNPSRVVGLDISEKNVSVCRERGFNVVQGNALALPFEDGSFDGVHSAQVMFAFPPRDASRYLSEIVRVTRPGGTISISTLCDSKEVFDYPEVARPYPPQAIFRMINRPQTDVGTDVPGVEFKAMLFRRPPLLNFHLDGSPMMWRVSAVLNALQYGCYLRKFWTYRGYTMILKKVQNPPARFSPRS